MGRWLLILGFFANIGCAYEDYYLESYDPYAVSSPALAPSAPTRCGCATSNSPMIIPAGATTQEPPRSFAPTQPQTIIPVGATTQEPPK